MVKRKRPQRSWILISTLCVSGCAGGTLAAAAVKDSEKSASLFHDNTVLKLQIEISAQGLETLRKYEWSREATPGDRTSASATVREGDRVYTNVSVHLKGAAGSFRSVDDKPGLTLNFDKLARGQRFHGLEKVSLNNSVQDPTFITDKLCRELFDQAGVPVPRAAYATVKLNQRGLGLYVLTEGWNKQFLKRYFKNTRGNLYDCGFSKDITGPLIANSGETPDDHLDVQRLVKAAREKNLSERLPELEKILDLDRFITLLALDAMLWNWDGYAIGHNNYRLFHDLATDRFVFFPHGMDQMFWKAEAPIMPGMKALVASAVMEIPECRQRYLGRVSQLITNICAQEKLTNRVQQLAAKLAPIQTEPAGWGNAMRKMFRPDPVNELIERIVERSESLEAQLQGIKSMHRLGEGETLSLKDWTPRTNFGTILLSKVIESPASLVLDAKESRGGGAWVSMVWLEGGHYRVKAKARVQGVTAGPKLTRAGAGFRVFSQRKLSPGLSWDWFPYRESYDLERRGEVVAKVPNAKRLSGTADWSEITCDFDLEQPAADLEIACELRADQGKAWFDLNSLKVERR